MWDTVYLKMYSILYVNKYIPSLQKGFYSFIKYSFRQAGPWAPIKVVQCNVKLQIGERLRTTSSKKKEALILPG